MGDTVGRLEGIGFRRARVRALHPRDLVTRQRARCSNNIVTHPREVHAVWRTIIESRMHAWRTHRILSAGGPHVDLRTTGRNHGAGFSKVEDWVSYADFVNFEFFLRVFSWPVARILEMQT